MPEFKDAKGSLEGAIKGKCRRKDEDKKGLLVEEKANPATLSRIGP